ncbi:MAG: hypothetical protein U1F68_13065 [Gammaproteobacteria bacterium]
MGGWGSGRRWHIGAKAVTADYRRLDVRRWQRDGLLEPGRWFRWQWMQDNKIIASIDVQAEAGHVVLRYRHRRGDQEWQDEEYPVRLVWTPCTYGGKRAWFLCPALGCRRRVAILYGGAIFACRHCYRLAYPSQRENAHDRALRRRDRIRARLGWEPGILRPTGDKPKGMHRKTFFRLTDEHHDCVLQSLAEIRTRLGIKE